MLVVQVLLQGSPAAAVYPIGCGVRFWRPQFSLGQLHPPCSWTGKNKQKKNIKKKISQLSVRLWMIPLSAYCCPTELDQIPSLLLSEHLCARNEKSVLIVPKIWAAQPAALLNCLAETTGYSDTAALQKHFLCSARLRWSHDIQHGFTTYCQWKSFEVRISTELYVGLTVFY